MIPPWVIDEIRSHPYRMWLIQAIGLVTFTLILISGMPPYEYTTYVYPTIPPRAESSTAVKSKEMAVSKKVTGRPSRPPRDSVPDPLPGTPVPSARPVPTDSEPSEPTPRPDVPTTPPSAPTTPPDDQGEPPVVPSPPSQGGPTKEETTKDPVPKEPQRVNIREANEFGPRTR